MTDLNSLPQLTLLASADQLLVRDKSDTTDGANGTDKFIDVDDAFGPYVDTAANLSAANPVIPKGLFGYATDTDVFAPGDGTTAWNSLPKYESTANSAGTVLDKATTIVAQTGITTAPVDLTGLSISFTVGTRPVEVEMHLPFAYCTTAGPVGRASIATGAGVEQRSVVFASPFANTPPSDIVVKELITAPGSYTRKGMFGRNGASGTFANGIDLAQYTSQIKATVQ